MRLLFVVDGRSPIALNWISRFTGAGWEVHLVSTFPCEPALKASSFHVVPVAFSGTKAAPRRTTVASSNATQPRNFLWGARLVGFRTAIRQWLGFTTFPHAEAQLGRIINEIKPEIIHAMRIPYEGMLAALALERLPAPTPPLVISVWGNDFTLHARSNPWMAAFTRRALRHTSALHTDCLRDQCLAFQWGFDPQKPSVVLPGGGGVQLDLFFPPEKTFARPQNVINPRGVRAYVRNDIFFRSIPFVLAKFPEARFFCPTMLGEPQAVQWVNEYGIAHAVDLLPRQSRGEMAALFRGSQVAVSPSFHDGTPNTLLEAMACGCYPVAGYIESLREWITPGLNGALVDPGDAIALAQAICQGLGDPQQRQQAAEHNLRLITERAEYGQVMKRAEEFYEKVAVGQSSSTEV